jgi:hypothetical protein
MPAKEIRRAVFVESNVRYIPHENLYEHFVVSINDVRTKIYLSKYNVNPQTGGITGPRDIKNEQDLIESFNPGDLVDLTLNTREWRINDRRGTQYYLISIARSL